MSTTGISMRLRASPKLYATWVSVWSALVILSMGVGRRETMAWGVAVLVLTLGVALVHVWRLEVRLTPEEITSRTLFRTRSMRLADISESLVHWDSGESEPEPLLVLVPVDSPSHMVVNLRPFRRHEAAKLLAVPALKLRLPKPR